MPLQDLSRCCVAARGRLASSSGCRTDRTCTTVGSPASTDRSGIIGILYTSVAFGTLIGPSAAGFAFDLSHSYTVPIIASAAANIIAAVIMAATSRVASADKPGS